MSESVSVSKERFYRHFQTQITTVQGQIEELANTKAVGGAQQDSVDVILGAISQLSKEVADASYYVPAYDQRAYSQAIKAMTAKLDEALGKFAPKSRFRFKPREATAEQTTGPDTRKLTFQAAVQSSGNAAAEAEADDSIGGLPSFSSSMSKNYNDEMMRPAPENSVRKPSFSSAKNIAIYGHNGLHIILPPSAARATSCGSLTDLERCIVDMTVPTSGSAGAPFAGLTIKNVKSSLIIVGHVSGAAHITGVKHSVLVVAARQVRIHDCENVQVYLHCGSHPIIEDSHEMHFAPIPESYMINAPDMGINQWDQVDDFKWLKTEPSPNWSILPDEKRVPHEVWTKTVLGSPSLSTNDILEKVGVPWS